MVLQAPKQDFLQVYRIEMPLPFAVKTVNAYLLCTKDERVLVDCGLRHEDTKEALLAGLAEHGVHPSDLTGICLTHGHVDHVGLAAYFQAHGVPIYTHAGVASWLNPGGPEDEYRISFFRQLYQDMGMPREYILLAEKQFLLFRSWNDRSVVNHFLHEGDAFPLLPQFRILLVPGHAQAAIALWNAHTGQLFIGDQLLPHISSNAFIEPMLGSGDGSHASRTKSLLQYRENLKTLQSLPIQTVYPGHGEVFHNAEALLQIRLDEQSQRKQQVASLLAEKGTCTAFELAFDFFPQHRQEPSLILSETLGYLDWLEQDGLAVCETGQDGAVLWYTRARQKDLA